MKPQNKILYQKIMENLDTLNYFYVSKQKPGRHFGESHGPLIDYNEVKDIIYKILK